MIFFAFLAAWVLYFAAKSSVETVARLRPLVATAAGRKVSATA